MLGVMFDDEALVIAHHTGTSDRSFLAAFLRNFCLPKQVWYRSGSNLWHSSETGPLVLRLS